MAQVVLGSSPDSSTVAYASMSSSPPLADKTNAFYQAQVQPVLKVEENKNDPASILAHADAYSKQGEDAFNEKNYRTSYLHYRRAKGLYEQLPKDSMTIKKLIQVHYDLSWVAMEIRKERRTIAGNLVLSLIGSLFFGVGCLCAPCFGYQLNSSHWVDNRTFRSYIDDGLKMTEDFIQAVQQKHNISMNTNKDTVAEAVRKDLGWAYSLKANFYKIEDRIPPNCGGATTNPDAFSDCCFEGTDGRHDASRHDNATELANLKLAKEWDPSSQKYEASYQKLDAYMKRPIVYYRS